MILKPTVSALGAAAVGLLLSTTPTYAQTAVPEPVFLAQADAAPALSAFLPDGVTLETATNAELDAALSALIEGLSDEEVVALVEQLSAAAPARAAQIAQSAALARPDAVMAIAAAAARGAPDEAGAIVAAVVLVAPAAADGVVSSVLAAAPGADGESLQQAAALALASGTGIPADPADPGDALPFFDEQEAQFEPPPEDEREPVSPTQL